jgi:iron complex outermembrane receptor protein
MRHPFITAAFATAVASRMASASASVEGQGAVAPNAGVVPPIVKTHVDAVYPPDALAQRLHRQVILAVTVDVEGHASKVDVLESGGPDLDEAAIVAARQWTFVPAQRDGKPVASRIRVPFHFAPPAPPPELVESKAEPGDVDEQAAVPRGPALPGKQPEAQPEEVVVLGRTQPPSHGPSDFQMSIGSLAVVPRASAGDFLKLAPGISITNEGGEGHAESIVLRGFDAGEGEDMELSVGGVPINDPGNFHGNGYADTHFILPEIVESVRVLEGPFDPHQGNFAVAGGADYELGLAQRGLTAKYTLGSFGTDRAFVGWGPENESRRTFGVAEYAQSNGYGQNRAYKRGAAIAQYEGRLGDRGTWRVMAQAYSVVSQAAGVIREDDYESGRIGFYDTYDPNQGQDSSRFSVAADLETKSGNITFAQQVFAIDRALRIREDFTGYVTDDGTEDPRGTMLDLAMSEQSVGARGSARMHVDALGRRQELELGYFVRGDTVNNVQRLIDRATQVPYATDASLGGTLGDLALYADANLRPLAWLTLRGGLRGEAFTYFVEDHCVELPDCSESPEPAANPRTSAADSALLPRVSFVVGPLDGFAFSASYGQGVRSLAIDEVSGDPSTPLAKIGGYEGGISYSRTTGAGTLTLRSVFFDTQVSRDQIFSPTEGRDVDTGATSRTGWVGAGRFTGAFLDESANVAAVRGIVDATHETVPYVPHLTARSETAVFGDLPWKIDRDPVRASVGPAITYVGVRSLPYGQTSVPYVLVDAAARLRWRALEVSLAATNVFDVRYRLSEFTFISDFHELPNPTLTPERSFTAGAPRTVLLSLAGTLGG